MPRCKNGLKVTDASRISCVWKNLCKSRKLSESSLSLRRLSVSETLCGFRPTTFLSIRADPSSLPLLLFSYEKWSEHRTTFTYGSYEPNLRDASRKIFKRGSSWSRVNINYFEPFQASFLAGKRNFYLLWDGSPREDGLGLFRSPIGFFLLLFHLFLLLLFFNSFERSVSYRSCSISNGGGKLKIDLEKFRLE